MYPQIIASLCMAIGLILPFLVGQVPIFTKALLPMHIPVLISGFILGPRYGIQVGFILPLLRSFLFSIPILYPSAIAMAFELATYGAVAGICYGKWQNQGWRGIYISLASALLSGRIIWGIAQWLLLGFSHQSFTLALFWLGAFAHAWPGIILQFVIIPPIVKLLQQYMKKRRIA